MRIEGQNAIKISAKSSVFNFLKGIKIGTELDAKIVERPGNKEAILLIAGKKIKAEFLKGVPGNNRLILKLEGNKNNSYIFKLIDNSSREDFLGKLLDFSVFSVDDIEGDQLVNINRLINKNFLSIYEFNAFFLNLNVKYNRRNHLIKILNDLISFGIGEKSLFDLAILFSGTTSNSNILLIIYFLFGFNKDFFEEWISADRTKIKNKINNFFKEIDEKINSDKKGEIIQSLIELIYNSEEDDVDIGEIPFFNDNKFIPIKYLGKNDSWIFSVELSRLGNIEIISKKIDNLNYISIFVENDEVVNELERSNDKLYNELQKKSLSVIINVLNRKNILDKIVEIISYYSINSAFDIKV